MTVENDRETEGSQFIFRSNKKKISHKALRINCMSWDLEKWKKKKSPNGKYLCSIVQVLFPEWNMEKFIKKMWIWLVLRRMHKDHPNGADEKKNQRIFHANIFC